MKNSVFKTDLYRYYGDKKESFTERLTRPIELKTHSGVQKGACCIK